MLLPDLNGYRAESRPEDAVTSDEKPETDVDPGEFWRMSGVNT